MKRWRSRASRRKEPDITKAMGWILALPLLPVILLISLFKGKRRR